MAVFFKNKRIQVYRNRQKGNTNRYGMSATGTVWNADIQPAGGTRQQFLIQQYAATHTAFVDAGMDVKENDKVYATDGKIYTVKGVQIWDGAGLLSHQQLFLTSRDA